MTDIKSMTIDELKKLMTTLEKAGNEITAVTVRVGDPQRRIRNQYTGNHKQQI